jgi:hypothetical protein
VLELKFEILEDLVYLIHDLDEIYLLGMFKKFELIILDFDVIDVLGLLGLLN